MIRLINQNQYSSFKSVIALIINFHQLTKLNLQHDWSVHINALCFEKKLYQYLYWFFISLLLLFFSYLNLLYFLLQQPLILLSITLISFSPPFEFECISIFLQNKPAIIRSWSKKNLVIVWAFLLLPLLIFAIFQPLILLQFLFLVSATLLTI